MYTTKTFFLTRYTTRYITRYSDLSATAQENVMRYTRYTRYNFI